MAYTWEEVMFGIDVQSEQAKKASHKEKVEQKQLDEADAAAKWRLGLIVLGHALGLGPLGSFIGKQIGEVIADRSYDWESMEMEEGKFDVAGAQKFNRDLKKAVKDEDQGQALNVVMDLGKMYIMGGGLTAKTGELDLTTYGSGGVEGGEWSLYGRGTPGTPPTTMAGEVGPEGWSELYDVGGTAPSEDYLPSLRQRDGVGSIGSILSLYKQGQSLSTLKGMQEEVEQTKKEVQK